MLREHKSRKNQDIDYTKTPTNLNLRNPELKGTQTPKSYSNLIKLEIETYAPNTKTVRKDAVVMNQFVIGSDRDTMKKMSTEQQKALFQDTVDFFQKRYGHIVYAVVHNDEPTPQLQLGLVPIKDGRLSSKNLFTRIELQDLQSAIADEVGAKYGLKRGVKGSSASHLSELEYKLAKTQETLKTATMGVSDALHRTETIQAAAEATAQETIQRAQIIEKDAHMLGSIAVRAIADEMKPNMQETDIETSIKQALNRTMPPYKPIKRFRKESVVPESVARKAHEIILNQGNALRGALSHLQEKQKETRELQDTNQKLKKDFDRVNSDKNYYEQAIQKLGIEQEIDNAMTPERFDPNSNPFTARFFGTPNPADAKKINYSAPQYNQPPQTPTQGHTPKL
jgi:hypothetical protein